MARISLQWWVDQIQAPFEIAMAERKMYWQLVISTWNSFMFLVGGRVQLMAREC